MPTIKEFVGTIQATDFVRDEANDTIIVADGFVISEEADAIMVARDFVSRARPELPAPPVLLSWEKPKRLRPSKEHQDMYQSDTGIPGTYMPNMSPEDEARWKAKYIAGEDPRVEVRVTISHTQVLIVIRDESDVRMTMNGKLTLTYDHFSHFKQAVFEGAERVRVERELYRQKHRLRQ